MDFSIPMCVSFYRGQCCRSVWEGFLWFLGENWFPKPIANLQSDSSPNLETDLTLAALTNGLRIATGRGVHSCWYSWICQWLLTPLPMISFWLAFPGGRLEALLGVTPSSKEGTDGRLLFIILAYDLLESFKDYFLCYLMLIWSNCVLQFHQNADDTELYLHWSIQTPWKQ